MIWNKFKSNVLQLSLEHRLASLKAINSQSIGRPLVVGLLSTSTGLGLGARLILKAFEDMGIEAAYLDVSNLFPTHEQVIDLKPSIPDDGNGPIIYHINPPELLSVLQVSRIANLKTRYRAAIWAWEQTTLPPLWHKRQAWIDEIWASSHFLKQTFKQLSDVPTHYLPYPVTVGTQESIAGAEKTTFRVLVSFNPHSSLSRKNPIGAIKAFQTAFPDDPSVRMTLQSSAALTPEQKKFLLVDERIDLIESQFSDSEMTTMIINHDVFLSPHRSEGYGLSIAKSLSLGVPTIFTSYSGPEDFIASPSAFPLRYTLVDVNSDTPIYTNHMGRWAEPDLEQAASILREIKLRNVMTRKTESVSGQLWWKDNLAGRAFAENFKQTSFFQRLHETDQALVTEKIF